MAGKLDSCTVASLGATPPELREAALMFCCGCDGGCGCGCDCRGVSSGSLVGASSVTGKQESEAGDELWTTMEGVERASGFLICERSEFVRERERPSSPGDGDLRRGERGQWGVVSPEFDFDDGLEGRGARTVSVDDVGVSSGMLVDDRARWTAGAVELDRLDRRLGLASALLLRERKPGLTFAPEGVALRCCGRAGEASRDDSGEGEAATPKGGRCVASGWWRMGADMSWAVLLVGSSQAGVDVAGSALSATPVKDWKPSSASAVVDAGEVIMDVLLLQWARALVASCAGSGASSLLCWLGPG